MTPIAILDANVLFPAALRDFLVWLSISGAFRARWTDLIHDEWIRNVILQRPEIPRDKLERCRILMDENVPESLVTGFEIIIPQLSLPDSDDRHVLAAAIHSSATHIVTFNLKDFPGDKVKEHKIEVLSPDDFIVQLMNSTPALVLLAAKRQRELLKNPPKTSQEYLETLESLRLPQTKSAIQPFVELI